MLLGARLEASLVNTKPDSVLDVSSIPSILGDIGDTGLFASIDLRD